MSYAYQIILEYISADLAAVFGPGAIDALMARHRDPAITTLCEYASFVAVWDDSATEIETDITIRALGLGITLTRRELTLLTTLFAKENACQT